MAQSTKFTQFNFGVNSKYYIFIIILTKTITFLMLILTLF